MSEFGIGVAAAVGGAAIVVLVEYAWRTWAHHRRARARPASPEDLDARRRTLRSIAANDYHRQTRHQQE